MTAGTKTATAEKKATPKAKKQTAPSKPSTAEHPVKLVHEVAASMKGAPGTGT